MKGRRGNIARVGSVMEKMLCVFEPGDIVIPIAKPRGYLVGVVDSVCSKTGKVNVLWNGGSDCQHDPDEIVLEPNQNELVKTRLSRGRRAGIASDVPYGDQYTGCPQAQGIESPRGGGFSIMQDLQKDLQRHQGLRSRRGGMTVPERHQKNIALKTLKMSDAGAKIMGGMNKEEARAFLKSIGYSQGRIRQLEASRVASKSLGKVTGEDMLEAYTKRYKEIETDADKKHFTKVMGKRVGVIADAVGNGDFSEFKKNVSLSKTIYLGKVTQALMDVLGIRGAKNLSDLFVKMGGSLTASMRSRRAMYWGGPGRTYRLTKTEQDHGKVFCPRCKKNMKTEPFTKSEKLYQCKTCGFKVPSSKTTNTRVTIDIDKQTGQVDVDVNNTNDAKCRRGSFSGGKV